MPVFLSGSAELRACALSSRRVARMKNEFLYSVHFLIIVSSVHFEHGLSGALITLLTELASRLVAKRTMFVNAARYIVHFARHFTEFRQKNWMTIWCPTCSASQAMIDDYREQILSILREAGENVGESEVRIFDNLEYYFEKTWPARFPMSSRENISFVREQARKHWKLENHIIGSLLFRIFRSHDLARVSATRRCCGVCEWEKRGDTRSRWVPGIGLTWWFTILLWHAEWKAVSTICLLYSMILAADLIYFATV